MIRRPPRSTLSSSSAASDVYKRQVDKYFPKNKRDTRNPEDQQEGIRHVQTLRHTDHQPSTYECGDGGRRNHRESNPWAGLDGRRASREHGRCIAIPKQDPDPVQAVQSPYSRTAEPC